MDAIAQRIASILGSAPVIIVFGLWMIYHNVTAWDYTNFISDVAIEIGLLILRAEKVQGDRMEHYTKQAAKDTKQDLQLSEEVLHLLKKGK